MMSLLCLTTSYGQHAESLFLTHRRSKQLPIPFLWVVTTPQPDAFAKQPYVPENAPFSVQGWATCCDPSKVQPAEADGWMLGSSESSSSQADWLWADLLDLPFGVLQ